MLCTYNGSTAIELKNKAKHNYYGIHFYVAFSNYMYIIYSIYSLLNCVLLSYVCVKVCLYLYATVLCLILYHYTINNYYT